MDDCELLDIMLSLANHHRSRQPDSHPSQPPMPHIISTQILQLEKCVSHFTRPETKEFLLYSLGNVAVQIAVLKASFGSAWAQHNISRTDVAEFLGVAKLIFVLPRQKQVALVTNVISILDKSSVVSNLKQYSDIRRSIWEGKHAFLELLPTPQLRMEGNVAYMSIYESLCIKIFESCAQFDTIREVLGTTDGVVKNASEAAYAQRIRDDTVEFHLIMVSWSDDFGPNRSIKKKERFKVWIRTGNLLPKDRHGSKPSKWKNMMPVALAQSSEESSRTFEAEEAFFADMRKLDRPGGVQIYCTELGRYVTVRVSMIAVLGDQPERRGLCGWSNGGQSRWGKTMQITGLWGEIYHSLPCCDNCLSSILNRGHVILDCPMCLCWDPLRNSPLALFPRPTKWPKDEDVGKEKFEFRRVSFADMNSAVEKAHQKCYNKQWKKGECCEYLCSFGLNHKEINSVIKKAECMRLLDDVETLEDEFQTVVRECLRKHPSNFEKHKLPPLVTSQMLPISCIIPVLMHLLFLGLVKTIMTDITDWLSKQGRSASFQRFSEGLLRYIWILNISWCHPQEFETGTGGKWASEDYLFFSRVMMWMYQVLPDLSCVAVEDPELDINKKNEWTTKECKLWLKLRGLNATINNGSRSSKNNEEDKEAQRRALMARVEGYKTRGAKDGGEPKIVKNRPTPIQTQVLVQSLNAIISRLMAREFDQSGIDNTHRHILIFLTYYHRWDQERKCGLDPLRDKEEMKPNWLRKNNFCDLPFLTRYIEEFGPLVNFWDGDYEKFIQNPRTFLYGARKNCMFNCSRRLLQSHALEQLDNLEEIQHLPQKDHQVEEVQSGMKPRYHRYRNLEAIDGAFRDNLPISGFLNDSGQYCICVKEKRKGRGRVKEQYITLNHLTFSKQICAMAYHEWEWSGIPSQIVQALDGASIKRYLVFLPELCSTGIIMDSPYNMKYTVIADDWTILDNNMQFDYPTVGAWK